MASTAPVSPIPRSTSIRLAGTERKHLQKTSRKLEAMLGATPLVLEIDVNASFLSTIPSTEAVHYPPTPLRTHARRRRGHVFPDISSSSSASESSDDDDDDKTLFDDSSSEAGYVFVPTSTPRGEYQTQHIPTAVRPIALPAPRKRSKSEAAKPKRPVPRAPAHVLDLPLGPTPSPKKTEGKKGPAQPVLFRLRPSTTPSAPSYSKSHSTTHSSTSPLSPVFNLPMFMMLADEREAREREIRRKKLAKVTRTLGENVPPELVFGFGSLRKGKAELAMQDRLPARKTLRAHRPRSLSIPSAPPPAVLDASPTAAEEEETSTPTAMTTNIIPSSAISVPLVTLTNTTPTSPTFTHHRPKAHSHSALPARSPIPLHHSPSASRSLPRTTQGYHTPLPRATQGYYAPQPIGTTLAYPPRPIRDTSSLDSPRGRTAFAGLIGEHEAAASLSGSLSPLGAMMMDRVASLDVECERDVRLRGVDVDVDVERKEDWGKRKERGWSGEWNVKDMADVKNKLRALRGR